MSFQSASSSPETGHRTGRQGCAQSTFVGGCSHTVTMGVHSVHDLHGRHQPGAFWGDFTFTCVPFKHTCFSAFSADGRFWKLNNKFGKKMLSCWVQETTEEAGQLGNRRSTESQRFEAAWEGGEPALWNRRGLGLSARRLLGRSQERFKLWLLCPAEQQPVSLTDTVSWRKKNCQGFTLKEIGWKVLSYSLIVVKYR